MRNSIMPKAVQFDKRKGANMSNEDLVMLFQSGDEECIEKLYCQNRGLIRGIAGRYKDHAETEDLMQEGYFGLLTAAKLWDAEKGAVFSTYAGYWIRQSMVRYIWNCCSTIRLPGHRREALARYRNTLRELMQDSPGTPTPEEIAAAMGIDVDQVSKLRECNTFMRCRSLEDPLDEDGAVLGDIIPGGSDTESEVLEELTRCELAREIWGIVSGLPENEAAVIRSRYQDQATRGECAGQLDISPEEVTRLEQKGLKRMRHPRNKRKLLPYLEPMREKDLAFAYRPGSFGTFTRTWTSIPEAFVMMREDDRERAETL